MSGQSLPLSSVRLLSSNSNALVETSCVSEKNYLEPCEGIRALRLMKPAQWLAKTWMSIPPCSPNCPAASLALEKKSSFTRPVTQKVDYEAELAVIIWQRRAWNFAG